jgi:hypothetical protein
MFAGAAGAVFVFAGGMASAQRHGGHGGATQGASSSSASSQGAQQPPAQATPGGGGAVTGKPGGYRSQPLNLHKEALGNVAVAAEARARMRNGDCAGALDLFDQALASSIDPTLHRDRGLCHERLGDPYPAMDDFRAYLSDAADATDADDIRQRLARIEMDVYHHSSAPTDTPADANTSGAETASVTVTPGTERGTTRDELEEVEHDHDELQSPLRAGNGVSLAPFFAEHKWVAPGSSFGDSTTWSESVGVQFRYSFGPQSALVVEAGYETFNSTQGATISGLTSLVGYELRVPLDVRYDNQLLLGAGMGFGYLVFASKDASATSESAWGFIPTVRVGWRHLLTKSVGFDLTLGGGVSTKALSQSGGFVTGTGDASEVLAANIGLAWGL